MKKIVLALAFMLLGACFLSISHAEASGLGCINYSGASYLGPVVLDVSGFVIGCQQPSSGDADLIPLESWSGWNAWFQMQRPQFDTRLGFGCDDCWMGIDGQNGTQGIPIGFNINRYGTMYDKVFVNSNGSLSFGEGSSSYDQPLNEILGSKPGICAYCLDLENDEQLGEVIASWNSGARHTDFTYWGRTTFEGRPAFVATWINIPTYSSSDSEGLWNTFQIMLVDVDDANDDVNIIVNYGSMRNENDEGYTDSDDGFDNHVAIGLGNVSGDYTIYNSIVDDSGTVLNGMRTNELRDNGTYPLNTLHLNSDIPGRFIFQMEGGAVEGSTIDFGPGCTDVNAVNYLSGASSDNGSCKYPVVNLLGTGGLGFIDLGWNEPMSGDLSNLDSYIISYTPGNIETTGIDKTFSGYSLSGLSNGTQYTINVCAVYDMGGGDFLSVCEDVQVTTAAPVSNVGFGGGGGGGGGGSISGPGRNSPTAYPTIPLVGTVKVTEPQKPVVPTVVAQPAKPGEKLITYPKETVFNEEIPDGLCFDRKETNGIFDSTAIDASDEFKRALIFLNAYDMTKFDSVDGFNITGAMTRQQAAKMFSNFATNVLCRKPNAAEITYTDIADADETLKPYITLSYKLGLMKGSTEGKFRPFDLITKAELNAVLTRMILNSFLQEEGTIRYSEYNRVATELGIIKQGAGDQSVSRHDAALMLFRAYKDQKFAENESDSSYVISERMKYIAP